MPVGAMNATASAPIRTGRAARIAKAPVSTAAATTAISVESVMAVRAPSAAMDARQDSRPTSGHGGPRGGQARASQPSRPRQPYAAIRIDQVQRVLGEILQWTYPADAALSHWLRGHPGLGARDRSEVAEAVYDVLRHLRRYRQYGESGVGPASRRLAILGLAATLGAQELAEGLDAAEAEWLQRVSRIDPATLPRAVRGSIPDWLDERLSAMDSPDTLIEALNRQASLDLRVNPLKAERDAMLVELQQSAGRYEPVAMPYSPWGIRMEGRPAINRWAQFENGSIEVQDEGSQLLALLVRAARRDDHRFLRRRGRQDAAAGRADALDRQAVRLRCVGRVWRAPNRVLPAADCPMWFPWPSTARTTPASSAWPARPSACWSTRRAASARCAAIPT